MRTIKLTFLLFVTFTFLSIPSISEAAHCSHKDGVAAQLKCYATPSEWNKNESSDHEVKKEKKKKKKKTAAERKAEGEEAKEKITLSDVLKKLKPKN